jgi:hypothetical protein
MCQHAVFRWKWRRMLTHGGSVRHAPRHDKFVAARDEIKML